jgi:hypothetical protein
MFLQLLLVRSGGSRMILSSTEKTSLKALNATCGQIRRTSDLRAWRIAQQGAFTPLGWEGSLPKPSVSWSCGGVPLTGGTQVAASAGTC